MAAFSLMFVVATILALVVPRLDWRRRITHRLATLALPVFGLRVTVTGLANLPPTNCIVVPPSTTRSQLPDAMGGSLIAATAIVTVAKPESAAPSLTRKLKLSTPL